MDRKDKQKLWDDYAVPEQTQDMQHQNTHDTNRPLKDGDTRFADLDKHEENLKLKELA